MLEWVHIVLDKPRNNQNGVPRMEGQHLYEGYSNKFHVGTVTGKPDGVWHISMKSQGYLPKMPLLYAPFQTKEAAMMCIEEFWNEFMAQAGLQMKEGG